MSLKAKIKVMKCCNSFLSSVDLREEISSCFFCLLLLLLSRFSHVRLCGSFLVAASWIFIRDMWDLVPWLGIEPRPPALGAWSLTHWITREVPRYLYFYKHMVEHRAIIKNTEAIWNGCQGQEWLCLWCLRQREDQGQSPWDGSGLSFPILLF